MDKSTKIILAVIAILLLIGVVVVVLIVAYKKSHSSSGGGDSGGGGDRVYPIPGKDFTVETKFNQRVPKPPSAPYLAMFEGACSDFSQQKCLKSNPNFNNGRPWCQPTWYAIRYVNMNTGEYGPLSEWTQKPISAGASDFPCKSSCKFPVGQQSCKFNHITLASDENVPGGQWGNPYVVNIHQQTGTFNGESDGDIIGWMTPGSIATLVGNNSLWSLSKSQKVCNGC